MAWALLGGGTALAQTMVDDFATAQTLSSPPVPAASVVVGAGILGGERDLRLERTEGVGSAAVLRRRRRPDLHPDAGTTGELLVTWDGVDGDPLTLAPTGLGGLDLTAGGQAALRLRLSSATALTSVVIEVFTDAGRSSRAAVVLPSVAAPTDFVLPFESFVPNLGTGATFTSVGAITLLLRGSAATVGSWRSRRRVGRAA